jgi:hypothetical protein
MAFVPKELRKIIVSPSTPAKSSTFGDHAVEAWYLGPRLDGLRMHSVLSKEFMKTRISAQLEYHPDVLSFTSFRSISICQNSTSHVTQV